VSGQDDRGSKIEDRGSNTDPSSSVVHLEKSERDPFEQLAESFLARYRAGERPSVQEYADRYPELAEQIRGLFPALVLMEEHRPGKETPANAIPKVLDVSKVPKQLGEYRILREVGRGGMGVVYEAVQETLGRHVALKVLPFNPLVNPTHLERFRREARAAARLHHTHIVPVFGVGEFEGYHFFAMQFIHGQGLDDVLHEVRRLRRQQDPTLPGRGAPSDSLAFSVAESLLTGRFSAPSSWVRDRESTNREDGGLKIEEGKGQSPSDQLPTGKSAGSTPAPSGSHSDLTSQTESKYFRSLAQIGLQVAEALAYAHSQGVLHRDIKPSNLLLDLAGQVWITDFGLAKTEESDELTHTGDMVGTLRYMAPERLRGQADPRSDVYGLGITLYEMLTLRPAFADSARHEVIKKVAEEDPPSPHKLERKIPRDLETVVLKAIAKEPQKRYATAESMAEDLRRFLADRPIEARRSSATEQIWRWCRRNPAVASLAASVAALILVVATVAFIDDARIRRELHEKVLAEAETTKANQEAKRRLYASLVAQARASRMSRRMGQRFDSLTALTDATKIAQELNLGEDSFLELRNQAIAAMALPDLRELPRQESEDSGQLVNQEQHGSHDPTDDAKRGAPISPPDVRPWHGVAVSHDLQRYVCVDREGKARIRRVSDDGEIGSIPGDGFKRCLGEFSPDGQFFKLYAHNRCQLWSLTSGVPTLVLEPPEEPAWDQASAISPDSRELAVVFKDGSIGIYELPSGRELRRLTGNLVPLQIAYHPSQPLLALAGHEMVQIRNTDTGAVIGSGFHHGWNDFPWVQWRPDGKVLAACGGANDRVIHLWDVATGKEIGKLEGHKNEGIHFAFNHRGDLLVSNSWDGTMRFWDPRTSKQLFSVPVGDHGIIFSSDDSSFAAMNSSGRPVAIYELAHGREYRTLIRDPILGSSPRWSQACLGSLDRDLLIAGAGDGIEFFDPASGRDLGFVPRPGRVGVLGVPGELVTGDGGGLFRWPIQSDPAGLLRIGPAQRFASPAREWLACSRDGQVMASALRWGACVFRRDRPEQRLTLAVDQDVRHVAVSPDGRWVVTDFFGTSPDVKIWDTNNGELVKQLPIGLSLHASRFCPNGQWLATNGVRLTLWKVDSWEARWAFDIGRGIVPAFSPDSRLLAFETGQGAIRLIDLQTGQEAARLEDPDQDRAHHLNFTSDGAMLIAASGDSFSHHVWDLRAIRSKLAEMGLDWHVSGDERAEKADLQEGEAPAEPPSALKPGSAGDAGVPASPSRVGKPLDISVQIDPGDLMAREKYSLTLAFFPWHAEAYYQRGLAYGHYKQWAEAREDFSQAIALKPGYIDALIQRAHASYELQDWGAAAEHYFVALGVKPKDATLWHKRAHALENQGHKEEAITEFSKAIELDRRNPAHWACRGGIYYGLKQWDKVIDDFSMVLELKPDHSDGRLKRGYAYCALRQWKQAGEDLAWLVQHSPPSERNVDYAGVLLLQGDMEAYRQFCRQVLQQRDQDKKTGQPRQESEPHWIPRILALAPNDLVPAAQVVDMAQKYLAEHPEQTWYHHVVALAHYRAGQWDQAIDECQKGLEFNWGGQVLNWLLLAMAHDQFGHADESRQWLDKAVHWIEQAGEGKRAGSFFDLPVPSWTDRLEVQLLLREIDALMGTKKP
jgi:serine/threonine protein kinase/WD40 repeat protein/tetratricopeptide (TPR) repeat protein